MVKYVKTRSTLYGVQIIDTDYWIRRREIPLGTVLPWFKYSGGEIPEEHIVSIPFDDAKKAFTNRNALNILLLGGSGDGKSLIMKTIWWFLHKAGYFCGYIDPKSTDSGRAKMKWENDRLPPRVEAEGIPLHHFMPAWSTRNFEHMMHNFRIYTTRISKIDEREMWLGLGMSKIAASKVAHHVRSMPDDASIGELRVRLAELESEDLPASTWMNVLRVLTTLEDYRTVDDSYQELDLLKEWNTGKSIAISYNSASAIQMSFDIGMKVYESMLLFKKGNRTAIMWFFDDSSYYTKDDLPVEVNWATNEILNIGNNYRSLGLNNCMAVQSLSIINSDVAETYKIKIISPKFKNPSSLSDINVPQKAIFYLKSHELVKNSQYYLMQWLLVDAEDEVVPFFPFNPPCNHFTPVYRPCSHPEDLLEERGNALICSRCGQEVIGREL